MRANKIKVHTAWFDPNSLEVMFGLSLSQLGSIFRVSRNMMSLIHRHERLLPDKANTAHHELYRASQATTEMMIEQRAKIIADSFQQSKKEKLERSLEDLQLQKANHQSRLNAMREKYHLLIAQIARSESIISENVSHKAMRIMMEKVIDLSKFEKLMAIDAVSPIVQFELQLKIDSIEFQIEQIKTELELFIH